MKPYTCSLTEGQLDWLRAESEATGLNASEILRRAIDAYREARSLKGPAHWLVKGRGGPAEIEADRRATYRASVVGSPEEKEALGMVPAAEKEGG
jgi:hypothetical protein